MTRLWTAGALVFTTALAGGCQSVPPPKPPVSAARSGSPGPGGASRRACEDAGNGLFPQDWQAWRHRTVETWIHTRDDQPLENLAMVTSLPSPEVTHMLRRGLEACDATALRAIRGLKRTELLPELRGLVATEDANFRVDVLATLKMLDPATDYSAPILALLAEPRKVSARRRAAELAAGLDLPRARQPLLALVRRDRFFEVRVAAAQSLLVLGDVHPGNLSDHVELCESLRGDAELEMERLSEQAFKEDGSIVDYIVSPGPLTAIEVARYAKAAGLVEQLLAARGDRKNCSPLARFGLNHLHFSHLNSRVLALTIDQSESSCEKELAFVLFIETDFPVKRFPPDIDTAVPDRGGWDLPIGPGKLPIRYVRAGDVLRVGNVELKRGETNVALVTATPQGATLIYARHEKLIFPHDANPLHVILEASDDLTRRVDAHQD